MSFSILICYSEKLYALTADVNDKKISFVMNLHFVFLLIMT